MVDHLTSISSTDLWEISVRVLRMAERKIVNMLRVNPSREDVS